MGLAGPVCRAAAHRGGLRGDVLGGQRLGQGTLSRRFEALAPTGELGSLVALFYALAYAGLADLFLIALAAPHLGNPTALLLAAVAVALTLMLIVAQDRRHPSAAPDRR